MQTETSRTRLLLRSGLSAVCLLVAVANAQAIAAADKAKQRWTIVELGALGSQGALPNAINSRGDIAGTSNARVAGLSYEPQQAFLWQNGHMMNIGQGAYSGVTAMNDKGTLLGQVQGRTAVWKDGVWSYLPFEGLGYDINKFDAIVGSYTVYVGGWPGTAARAFLYQDGVVTSLGTLGGNSSTAVAINDKGVIAGFSRTAAGQGHAFVYQDGIMRDLGTLGGAESFAEDINNHGVVTGASTDASGTQLAFIWDATLGMRPIMNVSSRALAINDRGAVVGTTRDYSFLYEDGTVTVLDTLPEVRAAGWTRLSASSINDRGWITGYGYKPGTLNGIAFVLIPR